MRRLPPAFSARSLRHPTRSAKAIQLDRLYQRVIDDVDALIHAVGLKPHDKPPNENKIHLATSITV
jgi:hypothetical protein